MSKDATSTASRKVEVLEDGNWESLEMQDLKIGDYFRLTDSVPSDVPYYEDGSKTYVAVEAPYQLASGVWGIKADEVSL